MGWDGEGVLAGRYRKLGRIGQGGMGAVWRAYDRDLDREVAIKELRVPEQVSEQERRVWYARMEREARAAARLRHPGIVTVYDRVMGEDSRPWIVMELIHGQSLDHLLAEQGALPERQVAAIGLMMLDALAVAHAHGVVHRDVKPANVLLEGDRVVLTDFGIAALEGDVTLTRSGAVLGTPAYMSPEQVAGRVATPASDLWSLGASLYAAVEGRPPFTAPTHGALFVAIATQDPAPPECSGPLAQVLNGLLRKDPADRLSVAQVRDLLTTVANPGSKPDAKTRPADQVPAPRTDTLRFTGDGRRGGRNYPIAVRGAVVCTGITAATTLLPWNINGTGIKILYESMDMIAPRWLLVIPALALVFSWGLWVMTHRPLLTLATVAVFNLMLAWGFTSAILNLLLIVGRAYGFSLFWVAGTAAFMFAFTGTNQLLSTRMPPTRLGRALLSVAVVAEGFVAVMWPTVMWWRYLPSKLILLMVFEDPGVFSYALTGVVALACIAGQVVIWSDKSRAMLRR